MEQLNESEQVTLDSTCVIRICPSKGECDSYKCAVLIRPNNSAND